MFATVGSAQNGNSQPNATRYCVKPLGLLQGRVKVRGASERVSKDQKEGEQLERGGGGGQPERASEWQRDHDRAQERARASVGSRSFALAGFLTC